MAKIKTPTLYVEAKKELIKLMENETFPKNRLPSEEKLAELLGVSRTTIREALMVLDREGVISKKQGVGNLIHKSTLNSKMRIDKYTDFKDLLEDDGYNVEIERNELTWIDDFAKHNLKDLNIPKDRYLLDEVIYFADREPAILTYNLVSEHNLKSDPTKNNEEFNSLSEFLAIYTGKKISHSISNFWPDKADKETSEILRINENEAIISWRETFYGIFDEKICFSKIVFHPEIVELSILSNWS